MKIKIVKKPISKADVQMIAQEIYRDMVKGVVDIERGVIALGGEWHMDANKVLLAEGSRQEQVWGFNLYPNENGDAVLEYISLINIRPAQDNRGMEVKDPAVRAKMHRIIKKLVPELFV